MKINSEIEEDFNLYHSSITNYKHKVDSISEMFSNSGRLHFASNFLPTYYVGNSTNNRPKYVLLGINPGFNAVKNMVEEENKRESLNIYYRYMEEFFKVYFDLGLRSKYYNRLANLFMGLDKIELSNDKAIYNYYYENVVSLDLIPYHSSTFSLPKNYTIDQQRYIRKRFASIIEFVLSINCSLIVINGRGYEHIFRLFYPKLEIVWHRINNLTLFSTFEVERKRCIMFSRMITQPGSGITYKNMKLNIPKLIMEH